MRVFGVSAVAGVLGCLVAGVLAWRHHVPASGWALLLAIAAIGAGLAMGVGFAIVRPRKFALAGVFVAAVGIAWIVWAPGAPGVTVVVIDCLSDERLNEELMPRTWALAEHAYRFENAHAQSSWTRTSVASMLTGSWPNRHQLYHVKPQPDRVSPDVPLLAPLVSASGRATAMFAEQAQLDRAFGLAAGFDRYGFRDGRANQIIDRYSRWRAFFRHVPHLAWIHILDIHKPYTPKHDNGMPIPTPAKPTGNPYDDQAELMRELNQGGRKLRAGEWTTLRRAHESEVRELDTKLGQLWADLRADGTLDTDWLVITADHGEAFGEHGWFTHGSTPWSELIEVPLVIRPPGGLRKARVLTTTARHIDLAPTILGFFGLPAPGMDGRDLGPALRGETMEDVPSFAEYFQETGRRISVTFGNRSLVRTPEGDATYDLAADPGQQTPLPPDPELLALLAEYLAKDGHAGGSVQTSDETMEGLRALGYLDGP